MTLIIAGKGDLERLVGFGHGDFSAYELHLKLFNGPIYHKIVSLPSYIKVASIHNPTRICVDGQVEQFDLADAGKAGKESLTVLKRTIELAKQIGARVVVVHGARYGVSQSREETFSLLEKRINTLDTGNVAVCFETDALWYNTVHPQKSVLASIEDFKELDIRLHGKLKVTADIEHLEISFYFSQFIDYLCGEREFRIKYPLGNHSLFERDIQTFIIENYSRLSSQFKSYLDSFFNIFKDKIEHIHLNGSDPFNFTYDPETFLPLIGEHLPLGFNKRGVKDRLNYEHIANLLERLPRQKEILVVLEVWRKDQEEFISEMKKSKQFLTNYLKQYREMR